MIQRAFVAASVALAAACSGGEGGAQVPTAPAPAASVNEALAACFEAQAKLVPFSGVVLAERGRDSFLRTAGFSDVEQATPMPREARFRLASVQKVITAAAVGRLVQEGRINLDAPVGTYVAGLPADMAAATIEQLLRHRAGVTPLTRVPPESRGILRDAKTARDLLPALVSQPLRFKPGEREEYSNGGYILLGVVIESVTGRSYAEHLDEALFRPLGMSATSMVTGPGTAVSLTLRRPGGGEPLAEPAVLNPAALRTGSPAGDGVSTADDMMKFARALMGDRLMSPAIKARVFPKRGDIWRIGQAGGTIGVNTDFAVYPETGWATVVLSNFDPPAGELMGEVIRGVVTGKGCTPLSPNDRPSPFRQAPPASAPGGV